jgi:hypothetical protein
MSSTVDGEWPFNIFLLPPDDRAVAARYHQVNKPQPPIEITVIFPRVSKGCIRFIWRYRYNFAVFFPLTYIF